MPTKDAYKNGNMSIELPVFKNICHKDNNSDGTGDLDRPPEGGPVIRGI